MFWFLYNIYRITAVIKVKTDSIVGIVASPIGQAVIMYVDTFKTDVIVFIGNIIVCLTSSWPIIFQYQNQFLDTNNQMNTIQITDKSIIWAMDFLNEYVSNNILMCLYTQNVLLFYT